MIQHFPQFSSPFLSPTLFLQNIPKITHNFKNIYWAKDSRPNGAIFPVNEMLSRFWRKIAEVYEKQGI